MATRGPETVICTCRVRKGKQAAFLKREMKATLLGLALTLAPGVATAQDADGESVRRAILDYAEGIYQADPARVERVIHADLAKAGFYRPEREVAYQPLRPMTREQLLGIARSLNRDGRLPKDAPREVVLHEVRDQTAVATLTAWWGIDHLLLGKAEGQWKIVHVLWQSHPPARPQP